MQHKGVLWVAATTMVSLAVACGGSNRNPTSPSGSGGSAAGSGVDAAADGTTLKATAPILSFPLGGVRLAVAQATLTFQASRGLYVQGQPYVYRVQLQNANGVSIEERTGTVTSFLMNTVFQPDTLYRWRVRAELADTIGPWSTTETFRSLEKEDGYIRGNELYDPLIEGKTVGTVYGPVTFIPDVGVRMESQASYIEYTLPVTLASGEYSALISGLEVISSNEDPKDRMITMREGDGPINDNLYRMSVDKRGNGAIAWRFLTGPGDYIETIGQERRVYPFHERLTYFVQATWGNNFFNVLIREGGVDGTIIYENGKPYSRAYTPLPHRVYIGSPYRSGDRGEAATVKNMVVRQVWVSPNGRPFFANK